IYGTRKAIRDRAVRVRSCSRRRRCARGILREPASSIRIRSIGDHSVTDRRCGPGDSRSDRLTERSSVRRGDERSKVQRRGRDAEMGGHTAPVGVIVFASAAAAPDRVRSPAAGQSVTGSWAGEESPDALPPGASRPVGYPVMVVYANAAPVDLRGAKLTDASGRDIAVSVVPQIYERDYVGVVPTAPLAAGARYRVRLELSVGGSDVVDEWEFETER